MININGQQTTFICQITENSLKIVKCLKYNGAKTAFIDCVLRTFSAKDENNQIREEMKKELTKAGLENKRVILSLPRNLATSKHIRVPSQSHDEIEKIVSLQAPAYLPYGEEELITGHEIVNLEKDGFSNVNLIIAHQNSICRHIELFQSLKILKIDIFLSSYGLKNLYESFGFKEEHMTVMLLDIDEASAELAIVTDKRIMLSRHFKIETQKQNWADSLTEEIIKTCGTYFKEGESRAPFKTFLLSETKRSKQLLETLNEKTSYLAETLPWKKKIDIRKDALNNIMNHDISFASLIGLGLKEQEDSLSLLPADLKKRAKKKEKHRKRAKTAVFLSLIGFVWFMTINKYLENKSAYAAFLNQTLSKASEEAALLDRMKKTSQIMEHHESKETSILDMLTQLHQAMPQKTYLTSFSYEGDKDIVIRGQTDKLNSVFILFSNLGNSAAFNKSYLKIKYATKRMSENTENVDFEIASIIK